MFEAKSVIFIEHFSGDFSSFSWNFYVLCFCFLFWFFFWNEVCVQFLNLPATFGDLPTSLGFEWGLCPVLLSFKFTLNMFLLCSPCPLGTPLWLLEVCCLEWKFSRQVIMPPSSLWTSGKGSDQWRPSRSWDLQGWVFSVPAVHSPPLLLEYFASALISLEIKMLACY